MNENSVLISWTIIDLHFLINCIVLLFLDELKLNKKINFQTTTFVREISLKFLKTFSKLIYTVFKIMWVDEDI